jgi:hypothetical protein
MRIKSRALHFLNHRGINQNMTCRKRPRRDARGDNPPSPKRRFVKNLRPSVKSPRACPTASLTAEMLNELGITDAAAVAAGVAVEVEVEGTCRFRSKTSILICVLHNTKTDLGQDGDRIRVWRTS